MGILFSQDSGRRNGFRRPVIKTYGNDLQSNMTPLSELAKEEDVP